MNQTRVNHAALLETDLTALNEIVPLSPDLVESFVKRNQQPHRIDAQLEMRFAHQYISQEEIDTLYPRDEASGWKLFDELYPNTRVSFIFHVWVSMLI